ncbi:CPBP family glutamic-type intramembrane protease [Pseudoalteromonas shioyasakiensis]|uniref:CPBP family glutamic-type intramembrane protease n=1 Tax=Pseudoalteromonas shioyasakiensis TaxID=1190813 RepID=A0ABT6TWY1_9GAMM|nr:MULTISPECIES: CPBP family intramembrane glutamic endopeptidase [Pseudoalteromonas]MDI4668401.1 CPBP family glutamic-type intramembrane protease [Pseudoalteromonas shioyasakiensis]MDI4672369.1 CPBP family glutamic-type intramembrane protease [Pseudoalteromonas shioyasakiensis]MDI4684433.1 CPBP family glutamic-type intramembrane protease [Pseudoalteromonas shioyasakiensis]MDI4703603.1 CPBP family glutamic-type intramembrane protease [Pseudoalteromonas shioyasakiensis]NUJ19768.1 CPBP family in
MNANQYRWLEFTLIFVSLPLLGFFLRAYLANWLIPALIILMAVCGMLLLSDPHFKRFRLTSLGQFSAVKRRLFSFFFLGALFSGMFYGIMNQENWFSLPRNSFNDWLMLLLLYPILSVMPQELIFRTYFFHRYKRIMPSKTVRIIVSASVFALAHIVYANILAVLLAFLGGLLFSYTYAQSRSTFVCVIEHSLWGLWMFTLGLGDVLDAGAF